MDFILSPDRVDAQECEILVSGFFQDERPLRGPSGWIDWRLNGRLSRLLIGGRLAGKWKETILIPSQGRIRPRAILLIGLGKSKDYSYPRVRELSSYLLETLAKLGAADICLSFPYEPSHNVDCGKLVEVLIEEVVDCLQSHGHSFEEEWTKRIRLFFAEGEERFPEVLLGVRTARSILEGRMKMRIFVPTERSSKNPP